jgi:hypothetical protein
MPTVVPVQRSVSLDLAIWSCCNFQSLESSYSHCIRYLKLLEPLELLEAEFAVIAPVIFVGLAIVTPGVTLFHPGTQMAQLVA